MGSLSILEEARSVGLTVRVDAGRLVIRGPRSADTMARRLLDAKADVMAVLEAEASPDRWEASRPPDDDPRALSAWWLARYRAAGADPPEEMIEAAEGRRSPDEIPTHPGWPTNDQEDRP